MAQVICVKGMYISEMHEAAEERLQLIPRAKVGDSSFNWKDEIYEEICREMAWIVHYCPSNEAAEKAGMKAALVPYPDCVGWRKVYNGEVQIKVEGGVWQGRSNPFLPWVGRYGIDWRFKNEPRAL